MPDLWGPPIAAFLLSVALTMAMRSGAHLVGAVAKEHADRWHRGAIPLLGGVAIAGAVLLVLPLLPPLSWTASFLLAGAAALAIAGLVDDFHPLRPQVKFLIQVVVTGVVVAGGVQLSITGIAPLDQLLTLAWIVGVTNAFNLLDNMDGLAAGVGLIAAGFRCYFFLLDGNLEGAALAATLAGSLAGFLIFNFQPASIFMGDTGSLFIGMMVSGLNVIGPYAYNRGTVAVLLLPVLILLVPIFDTLFVSVARTLAGRPIAQGGRDHTSHRLVALGMSERGAVLTLWGMAAAAGGVAALSYEYGLPYTASLVGSMLAGLAVLAVKLGLQRVYPASAEAGTISVVADLMYKKQIATIVLDVGLVALAYYSAYLLRFEQRLAEELPAFGRTLLIVLVTQVMVLGMLGTYRDSWRYSGIRDLARLAGGTTAGTALALITVLLLYRFEGYSRGVFVIHWLLATLFLGGSRVLFRALGELWLGESNAGPRTVIYGAGAGGVMVLREARSNRQIDWQIVGFIDDDRNKHHTNLHGVPVLGSLEQVTPRLAAGEFAQVVVSTSTVGDERLRALARVCDEAGVRTLRASLRFDEIPGLGRPTD